MSTERGVLKLKFKQCVFGKVTYEVSEDGGMHIKNSETDFLKLSSYCLKKMEPLLKQSFCLKKSALELDELYRVATMANQFAVMPHLNLRKVGQQIVSNNQHLYSIYEITDIVDFIAKLVFIEYQAFKRRQRTGSKVALKKGITLTQKSHQAGKVML